jgi:allantoate deiminase
MRAVEFDGGLTAGLEAAVRAAGCPVLSLRSGAGHDAMVMAERCPTSMLFVRCRDGLSHHPEEFVASADVAVALRVFCSFLRNLKFEMGK